MKRTDTIVSKYATDWKKLSETEQLTFVETYLLSTDKFFNQISAYYQYMIKDVYEEYEELYLEQDFQGDVLCGLFDPELAQYFLDTRKK